MTVDKKILFEDLKQKSSNILSNQNIDCKQKLTAVCTLLQQTVSYYDWVGFYFANHQKKVLLLKTFAGEPTEHRQINFGKGICGQVAVSNQNFIVPNVQAQDNYIACSLEVKSEIVIPIFKNGKNIGQIDIDSHTIDPFTDEDVNFLEWINQKVAEILPDEFLLF